MGNTGLEEAQAGIKISRRKINSQADFQEKDQFSGRFFTIAPPGNN